MSFELKKVLILAYDFPPYVSVGGHRPYSWFCHLRDFGIEPIIVTRQWSNVHGNHLDYVSAGSSDSAYTEQDERGLIIRSPYRPNLSNRLLLKYGEKKFRTLRKIITAFYEVAQFFLPTGPRVELWREADRYLSENRVDAIVATGEPFVLFHYASELSEKYGIPWLADYRDPWSQSRGRSVPGLKWLTAYLERRCLRNAHSFVTVSEFVARLIRKNVPSKDFSLILNGYDGLAVEGASRVQQARERLTIAFAGTVYKWHPLEGVLAVCQELLESGQLSDMELQFYGVNVGPELRELVASRFTALQGRVLVCPRLAEGDLAKKLGRANLFLLFNDYSILGTKIFTYLGMKRRILLCFARDQEALALKAEHFCVEEFGEEQSALQADVINETRSGVVVRDSAALRDVLLSADAEFQSKGRVDCHSIGTQIYSRRLQAQKLAELLRSL